MSKSAKVAVLILMLWLMCTRFHTFAFIDPKFTPDALINNSQTILSGVLEPGKESDEWRFSNVAALKGEEPGQLTISLSHCKKDDIEEVRQTFSTNGKATVILFAGTFEEEKMAFLHANNRWLSVKSAGPDHWNVEECNSKMSATFNGGTDMLIRLAHHFLAHPDDPPPPIAVNVKWAKNIKLGNVAGAIGGMAVIELKGECTPCVFVASTEGDRIFRPKKGDDSFDEITAEVKLNSKSKHFVWLDMNHDGLGDLVTWDGKAITIREQRADGSLMDADLAHTFNFGD